MIRTSPLNRDEASYDPKCLTCHSEGGKSHRPAVQSFEEQLRILPHAADRDARLAPQFH